MSLGDHPVALREHVKLATLHQSKRTHGGDHGSDQRARPCIWQAPVTGPGCSGAVLTAFGMVGAVTLRTPLQEIPILPGRLIRNTIVWGPET
jgi:hypothetical protein